MDHFLCILSQAALIVNEQSESSGDDQARAFSQRKIIETRQHVKKKGIR